MAVVGLLFNPQQHPLRTPSCIITIRQTKPSVEFTTVVIDSFLELIMMLLQMGQIVYKEKELVYTLLIFTHTHTHTKGHAVVTGRFNS